MKKLALTLTALTLALALAGCGSSTTSSSSSMSTSSPSSSATQNGTSQTAESGDLTVLMDALFDGIAENEMPMLMPQEDGSKYAPLTEENSEYNVGVARSAYKEGICAEAAMSAQAHSICLLKANSADDAAQLAKDVAAGANPRKWVCVEAERTIVAYSGDTVLLAMSFDSLAQTALDNFTNHFGSDNVTVVLDKASAEMSGTESGELPMDPVASMPESASGAL